MRSSDRFWLTSVNKPDFLTIRWISDTAYLLLLVAGSSLIKSSRFPWEISTANFWYISLKLSYVPSLGFWSNHSFARHVNYLKSKKFLGFKSSGLISCKNARFYWLIRLGSMQAFSICIRDQNSRILSLTSANSSRSLPCFYTSWIM